ncbi:hypothetical protein [Arthrobacter sp. A2-55]|uniref:hypothetical protein n=1 Tax=Arthrobacter sp. A2-55 TaxID=2897337 RepID=UPI0021CD58B0|nr:hypothetical protein [Arthrobacter sp. A2-55]MCU6481285.1 hypothetical protein [Arthrobacter sp. A2-55]
MTAQVVEHTEAEEWRRHGPLVQRCADLEAILIGRDAAAILDHGDLPEAAGIVVLPAWSWLRPKINVGRKNREHGTGTGLLMPIRTDWAGPVVRVVSDSSTQLPYRSRGLGHSLAGQATIIQRPGLPVTARPAETPGMYDPILVGSASPLRVRAALQALVEAGREARWHLLQEIEPFVRHTVLKAHSYVSYEIGQFTGDIQPMLDEISLDQVIDRMMYGQSVAEGEDPDNGTLHRLLELCMDPERFLRVDPNKYMRKHLEREAESEIRRRIGDPHIGPKIREIARQNPESEMAAIIDAYRKVYPRDRLADKRAELALNVTPDAMARVTPLTPDMPEVCREWPLAA